MADPFTQPEKLLQWAHGAHGTAKRLWQEFMTTTEHRLVTEEDAQSGLKIQKVVLLGTMPAAIEENATNALQHLRNSFDQMLFAACRAIGKPVLSANYPWATTLTDLNRRLEAIDQKTRKQKVPSEFWDLIRAQEPYPAAETHQGGNTLVRAMAALANSKHTVGIEITAVSDVSLGSIIFRGPGTFLVTGLPMPRTPIPYKDGVELIRWTGEGSPEPGYDYRVDMDIGFDESAPSELRFIPALNALVDFGMHAESCLNGFKRRVAELTA